jgi:NAD(P)-dependent dehydrogenase (short-subunit alcohol dehydrogenase family)
MVVVNMRSTPRVSLVTGGTDGIGRAVALQLAAGGDRILFVGRDAERGAEVLSALRAARPGVQHVFLQADLSLLSEAARVADEVGQQTSRLDAAVFCAGVLALRPEWTREGLERTFVLNYLSRYLLATRLVPALALAPSARLVLVANAGRYPDTLNFSDLQLRRARPGLHVSGGTQFANDLLAVELADRLRETRIRVSCVYPGLVRTNVFRNARGVPGLVRVAAAVLHKLVAMSPERAARTPVHLALAPHTNGTDGHFVGPGCEPLPVPARAQDRERRTLLWGVSRALVREFAPEPVSTAEHDAIFVVHR